VPAQFPLAYSKKSVHGSIVRFMSPGSTLSGQTRQHLRWNSNIFLRRKQR